STILRSPWEASDAPAGTVERSIVRGRSRTMHEHRQGPSAERNLVESLLPLLLIFAVMMLPLLFMSNRQKKMQQKQADLVKQLGVGDEVRTHSGFYGLIIDSYDDIVILESENGA